MAMQFELTIKLSGESLQEIDEALIQAAGARLTARVSKPTPESPPPIQRVTRPQGVTFKQESEKKGRGRPPLKEGETGKYERKQHVTSDQPIQQEPEPKESGSIDDARMAMSQVSERLGVDNALEALQFFGVSRVSELAESQLREFTHYCERLINPL